MGLADQQQETRRMIRRIDRVGEQLGKCARGFAILAEIRSRHLLDAEMARVQPGIERVDGPVLTLDPLMGVERGEDGDLGQTGLSAEQRPDRDRLAGRPLVLKGVLPRVDGVTQGVQQRPMQCAVPVQLGGEVLVLRIGGVAAKEVGGETRELFGRGVGRGL
ncbi:MAG: hypothetical protein AADX96_26605, partial [Thiocapsa sp. C3-sup]|uniref:hypothetical protein n=1 Tax=Thiocapsa sp. C3-sup TaxID=3137396 RepID=UPI0035B1338B